MRVIEKAQLRIGEVDIAQIKLNPKSRDDIPQLLRGLQHIYTNPPIRCEVFKTLEEIGLAKVNKKMVDQGWTLTLNFLSLQYST